MDSKPIIMSVEVIQYETDAGAMDDLHPALELHDIIGVFSPYPVQVGGRFQASRLTGSGFTRARA